ncbi:hypothetical protein F7725_003038 [Dissostichus mawsoni]|uniref:Uncharacterized protein n=1 Tax=Dissostichus mawsoni TaxID=36200 RepID=A0A7J5Y973_DISMA|nr:hypothetical protein F7725_003038 [Dissostichus mawsoni]
MNGGGGHEESLIQYEDPRLVVCWTLYPRCVNSVLRLHPKPALPLFTHHGPQISAYTEPLFYKWDSLNSTPAVAECIEGQIQTQGSFFSKDVHCVFCEILACCPHAGNDDSV